MSEDKENKSENKSLIKLYLQKIDSEEITKNSIFSIEPILRYSPPRPSRCRFGCP